jgi:hypothetical protein
MGSSDHGLLIMVYQTMFFAGSMQLSDYAVN